MRDTDDVGTDNYISTPWIQFTHAVFRFEALIYFD